MRIGKRRRRRRPATLLDIIIVTASCLLFIIAILYININVYQKPFTECLDDIILCLIVAGAILISLSLEIIHNREKKKNAEIKAKAERAIDPRLELEIYALENEIVEKENAQIQYKAEYGYANETLDAELREKKEALQRLRNKKAVEMVNAENAASYRMAIEKDAPIDEIDALVNRVRNSSDLDTEPPEEDSDGQSYIETPSQAQYGIHATKPKNDFRLL